LSQIVKNENLATPVKCAKFSTILSCDETLDNKPIIFVRKRVKTHLQQCRIPKFSGEDPQTPVSRKGKEREGGVEERNGVGREGRGWGSRKGRGGMEGLKKREGEERRKRNRGRGEEFGPPMF
jgi:hypothetical protein